MRIYSHIIIDILPFYITVIRVLNTDSRIKDDSIERVKPENYKNYFDYAYGTNKKIEYTRKPSTRKLKLKTYKDA